MKIPETYLEWRLYGAGLENFGDDGKPTKVPTPKPKPKELLMRIDACGLCFSDTKVVNLGENHPRLTGRNLKTDPAVLGHEVACTIVEVGEALKDKYVTGERYIVQADVFYQGVSMAFGYVFKGGLSQYQIIPEQMLFGDEGAYILPIKPATGDVEAALVEPWACVVAAYNITYRNHIKPEGNMLIFQGSGNADLSGLFDEHKPSRIVGLGLSEEIEDQLPDVEYADYEGALDWNLIKQQFTNDKGFDDILIIGDVPCEDVESLLDMLAPKGCCCLACQEPLEQPLKVDVGRIHYDNRLYIGAKNGKINQAYQTVRSAELVPGGKSFFIGAGGPMGQMHVQRAVQHPNPPKLIVAADVDSNRLEECRSRYADIAESRGINFVALNPSSMSAEDFDKALGELAPDGYDDVVCMAPVVKVIEHGAKWVGTNGVMNIFAGAARGTIAEIDMSVVFTKNARYFGSSGSSMGDIRMTLEEMESGRLQTRASLAALGGMSAVKDGLAAVKEGRFAGKIVILNQVEELPLMPLEAIKDKYPNVYAKLEKGKFWTNEAEKELLKSLGA